MRIRVWVFGLAQFIDSAGSEFKGFLHGVSFEDIGGIT